jgi:hypothetical protein
MLFAVLFILRILKKIVFFFLRSVWKSLWKEFILPVGVMWLGLSICSFLGYDLLAHVLFFMILLYVMVYGILLIHPPQWLVSRNMRRLETQLKF